MEARAGTPDIQGGVVHMAAKPALAARAGAAGGALGRATRAYWWSFWLFVAAFAIGTSWD